MNGFRLPGGDSRTTLIGATGTGKTTAGVWLLAQQRFDRRPWIILDFKEDPIFDLVGIPPIQPIELGDKMPKRQGLYLVSPRPGTEDLVEAFLWRLFDRTNIGLFVDEASLMPDRNAFRAILQQGRSRRIPVIACTQRPVEVKRGLFSEASFFGVFRLQDRRDYRVIEGFVPADLAQPLPGPHHWRWYDVAANRLLTLSPVPPPSQIAAELRSRVPAKETWHPFGSGPTGKARLSFGG
jgi:DNA helicase HerA-like ATPase